MKLALAQMLVEPGALEANVGRAEACIQEASKRGAVFVLLPECLDLGWADSSAGDLATDIPEGMVCRRLVEVAEKSGVHVCAGLVERVGDRRFNAAVIISPEEGVILHHRKIHELDFARELYACGDRLGVVDTPCGRIGLMICADGFAEGQVISRSLAEMGARTILSPCAWAVPADHDNEREPYGQLWKDSYGPVCRAFGITIAGCSNVGPITSGHWAGRRCIGASMVVGPDGEVLRQLAYGSEEIVIIELDV